MLKFAGTCSPEQLHTLQKVFDVIWMELRASTMSNYNGPSDPDVLRDEIAKRVLGQFNGHDVDHEEITKSVLHSFGVQTDILRMQSNNAARKLAPDYEKQQ